MEYNKKRRLGDYIFAIPLPPPEQAQPPPRTGSPPVGPFLFQSAKTPQELVYTVLLDQRTTFSKAEVLQVIEKLINLFEEDQFKGECPYIG